MKYKSNYLKWWALLCQLALTLPFMAQALVIDQISFTKAQGSSAVSGTIMVVVRNDTASQQTITGVKINGTLKVNGAYDWWRPLPNILLPGEVSTVLIHGNPGDASTPIAEGASVSIDILVDGGAVGASRSGVVLTTSTLRIGNVIPSTDWKTVTIYLRNLDTSPCTINAVYLNTNVTSQCNFVSGTTVATNGVGIIEVPFANAQDPLTMFAVRITATKTTSGDKSVAAPASLLVPWFVIGNWSSKMDNLFEDGSLSTVANYEGLRRAKQLQMDLNFGDNNTGRTKEAVAQWGFQHCKDSVDKNATPYNYIVGANGFTDWTDPSTFGWVLGEEMDNAPTGTGNTCADKLRYSDTILNNDPNHPTFINFAQQVKYFNKYGWLADIVSQDNYGDATAANANWLKLNTEPTRMVAWTDYEETLFLNAYGVMVRFWGQIQYGAKGIMFFKYGGYVPDDGNWFTTYANQTKGALQAVRELSQVRNLITYSDVSSAVATPSGTRTRLLVGKNQLLVVMVKTSSSGSVSGNLVVNMPSWIPVTSTPSTNFNVYRVTTNGMAAQSYTTGSGKVTIPISVAAGEASRLFVVGKPDTTAPAQPRNLCVADRGATGVANKFTLCWNDAWDNIGVKGYKVYNNGVLEGDVRYPMYDTPVLANPSAANYTVRAYDSQGNLGPDSLPVTCGLKWTFTQADPGDALCPHLDGAAAGWCHDQGSTMGIANGALVFNNPSGGGTSGRFISPSALRLTASTVTTLKLRMKNENPATKCYLECLTTASGGSWQWVADINVIPNDTQMTDYIVPLAGGWSGTIDKVRLNFLAQNGGICRIESIEIY